MAKLDTYLQQWLYGTTKPTMTPATFFASTTVPGVSVGGSVAPTLSLTLSGGVGFGSFTPGAAGDYAASTTANVISTAGDGTLSVADPSTTRPAGSSTGASRWRRR